MRKAENLIEVKEEVRIGNGIILEKGDKIRIITENSDLKLAISKKLNDQTSGAPDEIVSMLADWFEQNFRNKIKAVDISIMPEYSFQSYIDMMYRDYLVADSSKAEKINQWFELY